MDYFFAVDGGGTRTVGWLANSQGEVVGHAECGPSNPLKVGFRVAERELLRTFRECIRDSGLPRSVITSSRSKFLRTMCAGIAGAGRPTVHRPLLAWMRSHCRARHHILTSDAAIALAAAVRDAPGIVVISGTGSIAFARDSDGKILRAGGWGIPFDDRGSGYDLGRKAIGAALEAFDGRGRLTLLSERLCRSLGLKDISEISSRQLESQRIAALCPLVIEAARDGDQIARDLCNAAARDLANLAVALLTKAGWKSRAIRVVTSGSVFNSSDLIRDTFTGHICDFAPRARVEKLQRPPVEGALWLARSYGSKS
jgi:N-acetylglucosamine kinase-like BadF-type ATPase